MEQMTTSLLPVFIVLFVGVLIRKTNLLSSQAIEGLKTIIVKFALPAVLFMTFAQADMRADNILIFVAIFMLCSVLFLIGALLHKFLPKQFPDTYTDSYFTGFEFGMIGVGLFTAIWGMEKLPIIAVIGFGHEIFIWFIYAPLLQIRKDGHISILKIIKDFFKTPTVIAIFLGALVNLLGIYEAIQNQLIGASVINALTMLANFISPAILIVIGYAMTFKKIPIRKSLRLLIVRWILVLGLGTLVLFFIRQMMDVSDFFVKAYYAFIILPPPYVIPVLMKSDETKEISFFSELLIYYTVISFIGYIILMSVMV